MTILGLTESERQDIYMACTIIECAGKAWGDLLGLFF